MVLSMKKISTFLLFVIPFLVVAQELRISKGKITDNIKVNDTLPETFSLYLPSNFTDAKSWPVIFVMDLKGKGKQALSMFKAAAEQEEFILASSDNLSDTLTLSQNILISSRMFNAVVDLLPVRKNMSYTSGFSNGARFASIVPTFVSEIKGVISCGAAVGNLEILSVKRPFHFVGIAGREDYNFRELLETRNILDQLKFPNQLLFSDVGHEWPKKDELANAMRQLKLVAMAKGYLEKDMDFIQKSYQTDFAKSNAMFTNDKPILSNYILDNMMRSYQPFLSVDSVKSSRKKLRRSKSFKTKNRAQNNYFLKESFAKEDYGYYLEEDVITYNYNNLGWWNYQMTELTKMEKSKILYENQMAKRLRSYVNALIDDNMDVINSDEVLDVQALNFLYMLRTITMPNDSEGYLKVISNSSLIEDYGTALFYLEELLKTGYSNKTELYSLENTALLRITPEFNEIVNKYLKEARYDIIED